MKQIITATATHEGEPLDQYDLSYIHSALQGLALERGHEIGLSVGHIEVTAKEATKHE